MRDAARASDTIGTSATRAKSRASSGRSIASPAPTTIASAPLSQAWRT
jgi:hypothetical protein